MILQLPSNKSIELDGISYIDSIQLYEYPDIYIKFWYEFVVTYENGGKITYSYDTKHRAERDRDLILRKIHNF